VAKKASTTEDTEITEKELRLLSVFSVRSVVSLSSGRRGLEPHEDHSESRSGCQFAALSNKFSIQAFDRGKWEGQLAALCKHELDVTHPPGGYASARQTGFHPDLLPSGLYRRPRSFTGSWGLQAFCALSADCTGYLG
jgi:hypothetical protein